MTQFSDPRWWTGSLLGCESSLQLSLSSACAITVHSGSHLCAFAQFVSLLLDVLPALFAYLTFQAKRKVNLHPQPLKPSMAPLVLINCHFHVTLTLFASESPP